jgi:hypothetical protein
VHKFVCILLIPFLKDSAAEQQQIKYLLECVRKLSEGEEKECKHERYTSSYDVASSSKMINKRDEKIVISSDSNEDNTKNNKMNKKQKRRKRLVSRSSSEESGKPDTEDAPRRTIYFHLTDLSQDLRDALRVSNHLLSFFYIY